MVCGYIIFSIPYKFRNLQFLHEFTDTYRRKCLHSLHNTEWFVISRKYICITRYKSHDPIANSQKNVTIRGILLGKPPRQHGYLYVARDVTKGAAP